jgi:hypothetical protein
MAYSATLGGDQQLAIANLAMQTQITLTMSRPGQQQSQSSSFSTGKWLGEPKLFKVGQGFVLQIDTEQDSHYVLIQQNSISTIQSPAELNNYPQIDLKVIPDSDSEPMQPMQPLDLGKMKMGNMSMNINSMSMQMGNMAMSFNNQPKTTIAKQFCASCGTQAKTGDRFCRSCGHELDR